MRLLKVLTIVTAAFVSQFAWADQHYYMMVFGYQAPVNLPRFAHTFAVFAQTEEDTHSAYHQFLGAETISWMPASGIIRPLALRAENGVNMSLQGTLSQAAQHGYALRRWGPVEIPQQLYQRAVAQAQYLRSGAASYKVQDALTRQAAYQHEVGASINCIHAVSDLGGFIRTGVSHGFSASAEVFQHLERFAIARSERFDWIAWHLGVSYIPRMDVAELPRPWP